MIEPTPTATLAAVEATPPPPAEAGMVLEVSDTMVVLTWLAFIIATVALYKIAWKPILQALDRRENQIRQSLADAAAARQQAADTEAQCRQAAQDAARQAAAIIDQARNAAVDAARVVEQQARDQARGMLREAEQEIAAARDQAKAELRRETASLALSLTERLIQQKLDPAADRVLTDKLLQEMAP